MESNKKKIFHTMASVSGLVILSKILGFVKQIVTANAFGATIHTDIITLSEGLISNLDYLLVQALSTAFIPTYIYAKASDRKESDKFVSNTIILFLLLSFIISCVVYIGAPVVSHILAPSYNEFDSIRLARYIRFFAPALMLIVELAIFNALLKANEVFIPGEMIGLNQSIILIILVFLVGEKLGADTLVLSFYIYAMFNLAFLIIQSRKKWHFTWGSVFTDSNVLKLLKMMGPLLLGFSMVFINQQIDKMIVSGLGEGTVTAMGYASVLSNFICTFVGSICGVLFTYITAKIADGEDAAAAELAIESVSQIGTILIPISIITIVCSHDIVSIVFGRGKFNAFAIDNCSKALIGYGCMFIPYVIRELYSRFQYAYGDSKKPMINSTIGIVFNIIFSIVLSKIIGVLGVTIATSISVLVCAILNVVTSKKRNNHIKMDKIVQFFPRWIIGIFSCLIITCFGTKELTNMSSLIRFVLVSTCSLTVYFIITFPIIKPLIYGLLKKEKDNKL